MESPIHGIKIPITRIIKEADLLIADLYPAELVDENEYYQVWSNGVVVRLTQKEDFKLSPSELPMAEYPSPPYRIPKPPPSPPGKS